MQIPARQAEIILRHQNVVFLQANVSLIRPNDGCIVAERACLGRPLESVLIFGSGSLFAGILATGLLAGAAQAATVSFSVTNVGAFSIAECSDGTCNMNGAGMVGTFGLSDTLEEGESVGFEAFEWTALTQPVGDAAEDIPVTAFLTLAVGGGNLFFEAMGVMRGWSLSPSGTPAGGSLVWSPVSIPEGSPLRVVFDDFVVPAGVETAFVRSGITVTAVPSVVPLPGGIVLLVTALLGVFGLSHRRNFAAA